MGKNKFKHLFVKNLTGWLLMLVPLTLFVLIVWRPIVVGIAYSFFELKGFTPTEFVGFKHYKDVLTDTQFVKTLWNTVKYCIFSLIIGFPLPFIVAMLMNEMVHGKKAFKFVVYLPVLIPGMAVYMIWKFILAAGEGGFLNSILGVFGIEAINWLGSPDFVIPSIIITMTWNAFGASVITYLATLQSADQTLYDAARIDGAGVWKRFTTVTLPHMGGLLLLYGINQMISVFQVMEQPLVMTGGGPNYASMSLGLTNYMYAFQFGQFERSLALGVVSFLIMTSATLVYYKIDRKIND